MTLVLVQPCEAVESKAIFLLLVRAGPRWDGGVLISRWCSLAVRVGIAF